MSLLFNMLSRLVITFLPGSKPLLISWLQSPSAVILEPKKSLTVSPWASPLISSRWVITPLWLSGSWGSFLYSSSVYSCHLFLISSASVRSLSVLYCASILFQAKELRFLMAILKAELCLRGRNLGGEGLATHLLTGALGLASLTGQLSWVCVSHAALLGLPACLGPVETELILGESWVLFSIWL